jgi:hypothetical protein
MRRWAIAAALVLLAGAAALRVAPSAPRRESPAPATAVDPPTSAARTSAAVTTPSSPESDPLALYRGNAACDGIRTLQHRVRLYRKALALPTDEWIRLLNQIRASAGELAEAPPPMTSDAELAFAPGGFAKVQAASLELSRLAGDYYQAARTRNAPAIAIYRPAFEERWASFETLARQSLRR